MYEILEILSALLTELPGIASKMAVYLEAAPGEEGGIHSVFTAASDPICDAHSSPQGFTDEEGILPTLPDGCLWATYTKCFRLVLLQLFYFKIVFTIS